LGRVWSKQQAGQSSREDGQPDQRELASGRGIFIYEFVDYVDDYVNLFMLFINLIFC
jgi:hypothetical protein